MAVTESLLEIDDEVLEATGTTPRSVRIDPGALATGLSKKQNENQGFGLSVVVQTVWLFSLFESSGCRNFLVQGG